MIEASQRVNANEPDRRPVVWRLLDGKAGHESQTAGLCHELKLRMDCELIDIPLHPRSGPMQALAIWPYHKGHRISKPELIIAAGHQTHLWLLFMAWRTGAKSIVLMKPSLPLSWFDLCLIPVHDDVDDTLENVELTLGALNALKYENDKDTAKTFLMVGGPSKRHGWDEKELLKEIRTVLSTTPDKQYLITDSPRTPAHTSRELTKLHQENCSYFPFSETHREWFIEQLQSSGELWVTEDSISMIYESLTANGCVHVLTTPRLREDKITSSLDKLYQDKHLLSFANWQQHELPIKIQLNESARCAGIIETRMLQESGI